MYGVIEVAISFLICVFNSASYVHFRVFLVFGVDFHSTIVIPILQLNRFDEGQVAEIKYSLARKVPPLHRALNGTLTCPCCVDGQK